MCIFNVVANATNPNNDILTYLWEYQEPNSVDYITFGMNSNEATTPNFTIVGTYTIRCTLTDSSNSIISNELNIAVINNQSPIVSISFEDGSTNPQTCQV